MNRLLCLILLAGCSVDHAGIGPVDQGLDAAAPDVVDAGAPDSGPDDCERGDQRECGPAAMGACVRGKQLCEGGRWGACLGAVGPIAEVCEDVGVDEDCDGETNEGCTCIPGATQMCGTDVGECSVGTSICGPDARWGPCSEGMGVDEECNSLDDDCDGEADEGVLTTFYRDSDGDGFGVGAETQEACTAPAQHAPQAGDCRDDDMSIFPGAPELCNGADDNCNGDEDEGLSPVSYYPDNDRDGFGAGPPVIFCINPGPAYSTSPDDCDDTTAEVRPGGVEICDSLDNDCSGGFDEGRVCGDGCQGVNYGGHNYLFCTYQRQWENAASDCGSVGYWLTIVNNNEEQVFLQTQATMVESGSNWWLGLNDRGNGNEGNWEWSDGTAQRTGGTVFTYDNFNPGEPNNSGNEDCAEMLGGAGGRWNDDHCWADNYFICESRN